LEYTNVSEVRIANIITTKILPLSSLRRWRQYTPLKRRFTSTELHGAISQKAVLFIYTAVRN
jgi:hypothetical protein